MENDDTDLEMLIASLHHKHDCQCTPCKYCRSHFGPNLEPTLDDVLHRLKRANIFIKKQK